jgi:hypothetical protein
MPATPLCVPNSVREILSALAMLARRRILHGLSLVLFPSLVRTRSAEAEHIVKERSNFSLRPRYFCRWQLYTRIHLQRHDPRAYIRLRAYIRAILRHDSFPRRNATFDDAGERVAFQRDVCTYKNDIKYLNDYRPFDFTMRVSSFPRELST